MNQVRLGMIGLGRFAELHAPIWAQMPGVVVTAICDLDESRLKDFQLQFPQAHTYTDWQHMLARQSFDAVVIVTPEHLHTAPGVAALEAGAHVFVEKPLALTPVDALFLLETAERCNRILMAGHVLRFDPRYQEVKRQLKQGRAGAIRTIFAKRNNCRSFFSIYNRTDPIFILGIHDIDLMRWYMEAEVTEVYAKKMGNAAGTVDVNYTMLTFANGGIGVLENHWLLPEGAAQFMDVRMEITGEKGMITVVDPEQAVSVTDQQKTEVPSFFAGYEVNGRIVGPLAYELAHFIECILANRPSELLQPEDAFQAVKVAAAAVESARIEQPVSLSTFCPCVQGEDNK